MVREWIKMVTGVLRTQALMLKERIKWYVLAVIVAHKEYYKETYGGAVADKKVRYFRLLGVSDVPMLKMFEKINKVTAREIERDVVQLFRENSEAAKVFAAQVCFVVSNIRGVHWKFVEDIVEVMFRNGKYPPQYSLAVMDALADKKTFCIEYDAVTKDYWLAERKLDCGKDACPCEEQEKCKMNAFADIILSRDKETMPRA